MNIPRKYTEAESQWEFLLWALSVILAAGAICAVLGVGTTIAGHWPTAGAIVALLLALGSVVVMLYAVSIVLIASIRTIIACVHQRDDRVK